MTQGLAASVRGWLPFALLLAACSGPAKSPGGGPASAAAEVCGERRPLAGGCAALPTRCADDPLACATDCGPRRAFRLPAGRCETAETPASCGPSARLVRNDDTLGCFTPLAEPAAPACGFGEVYTHSGCRSVVNGQTVDLARWADATLVRADSASHAAFCAAFARQRADIDLRAARSVAFAVTFRVIGNDLTQLTTAVDAAASSDQVALAQAFQPYAEALRSLGAVSTLAEHRVESTCNLPASMAPTVEATEPSDLPVHRPVVQRPRRRR